MVAGAWGCALGIGAPACVRLGIDFDSLLVALFVITSFATPPALALVILWLIIELVAYFRG
jgi:hypothetical protein